MTSFVTILPKLQVPERIEQNEKEILHENEVLDLFSFKKEITRKDIEKILGCSSFPARKVLNSLIAQNKIEKIGNAKATKYILKK